MTNAFDLTLSERKTLAAVLERHVPGVAVWAFGSRVKGTAQKSSDLDLVVFATPELSFRVADLREALEESDLPFVVDLHVWSDLPERFHQIIREGYVVVQAAT